MTDRHGEITATVLRERGRLGSFIRRRVRNPSDAEDILQEVLYEFVRAYQLPEPIEQAGAWLFRVARHRIIDRFRKLRHLPASEVRTDSNDHHDGNDDAGEFRLDLVLPAPDAGPEAAFARSVLLTALQDALDELPANQREVFVAHELEGLSFKAMAARSGVGLNTLLARKRYAVLALRARLQPVYDELDL